MTDPGLPVWSNILIACSTVLAHIALGLFWLGRRAKPEPIDPDGPEFGAAERHGPTAAEAREIAGAACVREAEQLTSAAYESIEREAGRGGFWALFGYKRPARVLKIVANNLMADGYKVQVEDNQGDCWIQIDW